ncbi:hypothetical protein [Aeromonas salmonicida]|uniref:hypothetical protein n=1 Tax=Aeromonas salmonicida TaxID=645 RepID=UPI0038BAEC2E
MNEVHITGSYVLSSQQITLEFSYDFTRQRHTVKIISNHEDDTLEEEQFFIFEIESISSSFEGDVTEVTDTSNTSIGFIINNLPQGQCFTEAPSIVTVASTYSFLKDNFGYTQELPDNFSDTGYIINVPLLLINSENIDVYINNYMEGCEVWGSFSHTKTTRAKASKIDKIIAYKDISFPTLEQKSKISSSISSDDAFDRFLKKYQLIELLYDYIIIAKLRTIDSSLSKFRHTMSSYSKEEYEALKEIMGEYVLDVTKCLDIIYESVQYESIILDIFKKHGKESNPLKEENNWQRFWDGAKNKKLAHVHMDDAANRFGKDCHKQAGHRRLINNIIAYWIYRVRCSIAHYKIGEFIFDRSHEIFIIEVAEKLLDEVLYQVFSSTPLREIIKKSRDIDSYLSQLHST